MTPSVQTQARVGVAAGGRRLAIVGVAVALVVLTVVVLFGSLATTRAATQTQRAVLLNTAYQHAATAVAAEESLDREYRLEPSSTALADHRAAIRDVQQALTQVRSLGTARDRALASKVFAENTAYALGATELFAAVDRHASIATVNKIDTGRVDPIFFLMQGQVVDAAADHEALALHKIATMSRTDRLVLAFDIATLLAGMTLITVAGTALIRSQRRLRAQSDLNRHQALHDSLTGLPNRALFQDRTAQALNVARRSGDQIAVMLLDLNRFKEVNDTLGHHYGDLLLWQVAKRFSATMRTGDTVARLGGDEFAVLLCTANLDQAITAAERLTEVLQEAFTVKDISLDVDASIGIAIAGPDTDVETALRHADVAMYEAKSQHLPFATYELTRDDNTLARLALLGDLRRAITGGELLLHYQPKVSTTTGDLHSIEALVRWQHPTRGLLAPAVFIPIAESTAVIHPLTAEILRLALNQVRAWLDRGWAIPVAVNISARSLLDLTFPTQVGSLLASSGVPASLLSLELTESAIMNDTGRALTVLNALNEMGVRLSIDDFGTGYSSMAYLKALPVRELKIDRTFVLGITTNDSDVVLVQSAVDLGHNLGFHVVAEGVEDEATHGVLAAMGCDLMQGYHIRRPVTALELEPWLRTRVANMPRPATPPPRLRT